MGDRRGLRSGSVREGKGGEGGLRAWRRPTLPHLGVQYHRRRGFSRPSSGWDRVFGPSLWPPGRQGRSPEGGGPSARGLVPRVWRAAVRGFVRGFVMCGGKCLCEALGPRFHRGPLSRRRGERGSCRYARRRPALLRAPGSSADRAISTGQLRGLPRFHLRPIDVVVFHGSRRDLVLRRVSRLDAFSGYPVRT
jgi:hypothetical protein